MMNERIKELMRGAIADALMQPDRDGDMHKMYIPALFAENFAELILKEVISTIYRSDISDRKQERLVDELAYKFGFK